MKKLVKKCLSGLGYELKKIHKRSSNLPPSTNLGPFLSHHQTVDLFQFASDCPKSIEVKNAFINKIKNGAYALNTYPCPVCDNDDFTPVAHTTLGFRWGLCTKCGLLQCYHRIDNPSLNAFYESGEYQIICMNNIDDEKHYLIEYKVNALYILDIFERLNISIKDKCVLEIGCGSGGILRALQEKGATVYGFDLDSHRIEVGKKHIDNLFAYDAMDPKISLPANVDFILINNVLEHLFDPSRFLQSLADKIRSNDSDSAPLLLIDVPNLESAVYYSTESFLKFLHIAHLWYFNSITIERLLNQCGFKIEYIISRNASFTIVAKYTPNKIKNENNAYWNSISSINLANYIHDPNNLQAKVNTLLTEIF